MQGRNSNVKEQFTSGEEEDDAANSVSTQKSIALNDSQGATAATAQQPLSSDMANARVHNGTSSGFDRQALMKKAGAKASGGRKAAPRGAGKKPAAELKKGKQVCRHVLMVHEVL